MKKAALNIVNVLLVSLGYYCIVEGQYKSLFSILSLILIVEFVKNNSIKELFPCLDVLFVMASTVFIMTFVPNGTILGGMIDISSSLTESLIELSFFSYLILHFGYPLMDEKVGRF